MGDLVFNFFTGFIRQGEVILTFTESASTYLKGRFALDFGIVVQSIFAIGRQCRDDSDSTSTTVLRSGKVVRVLRVKSVMRLLRISEAVKRMIDNSTGTEMALTEIPALRLVMCFVSHVFA